MANISVKDLKSEVADYWDNGEVEDMEYALDLVLDQWGEDFEEYLDDAGYKYTSVVISDLEDNILDAQHEGDTGLVEDLQDKVDDINMDGGPLWDVSEGSSDEAENVFKDDFLQIIDDYAHDQ